MKLLLLLWIILYGMGKKNITNKIHQKKLFAKTDSIAHQDVVVFKLNEYETSAEGSNIHSNKWNHRQIFTMDADSALPVEYYVLNVHRLEDMPQAIIKPAPCNGSGTGILRQGLAPEHVTQIIKVNVLAGGSYDISATSNGVTFSGNGLFDTTGIYDIVLHASGTPLNTGNFEFALDSEPSCTFFRMVLPALSDSLVGRSRDDLRR